MIVLYQSLLLHIQNVQSLTLLPKLDVCAHYYRAGAVQSTTLGIDSHRGGQTQEVLTKET